MNLIKTFLHVIGKLLYFSYEDDYHALLWYMKSKYITLHLSDEA